MTEKWNEMAKKIIESSQSDQIKLTYIVVALQQEYDAGFQNGFDACGEKIKDLLG